MSCIHLSHHTSSRAEILPWTHPLHGPYITVSTRCLFRALVGGSSRVLLACPWPRTGPPLLGMGVLLNRACSFGRDVQREVREERGHPLHQPDQSNQPWQSIRWQMSKPDHPHDTCILDAYTNKTIQYMLVCDWLLSLSKAFSSIVHMVAWISTALLLLKDAPGNGQTTLSLSTYLSMGIGITSWWILPLGANSLGKNLMLGKIEGRRKRGWQRMRWLHSITNSVDMNLSKLQETVEDRGAWRAAVHEVRVRHDLVTERHTAINTPVQPFVWKHVFVYLGYLPRIRVTGSYGHMVILHLRLWGIAKKFSKVVPFTIPSAGFLHVLADTCFYIFIFTILKG